MPKFRINTKKSSVLFFSVVTMPLSAHAQASIDVPAQPLDTAIAELGAETGLQIVARGEDTLGQTSTPVSGEMTPTQALGTLLGGTGLNFQSVGANSVVVTQNNRTDDFFDLGTVVVKGERVERDVFNTTSSVRAYSGEELEENFQNSDVERVINDAANVVTTGVSNGTPVIRGQQLGGPVGGVNAALSGQLPRGTITVDGRPLSANELAHSATSVWDTEAVELFRGPQTTSQGANSIAGAINIRTRDPIFEQEFSARAEVGNRGGFQGSLMANLPVSDSVALRFTYDYGTRDNFINYPNGLAPETRADVIEQKTIRAKALWEPVSLPQLSTKLTISYTEFNQPQALNVVEPFSALISSNPGPFTSNYFGETTAIIHDIAYDLGAGFSVRNQLAFSMTESTRITGIPGEDFPFDADDWVNEFILDYAPEGGALSGIFGVYVRDTQAEVPPGVGISAMDEKFGYGIFGEATYRFGNGFDVTAGLRYQENSQDRFASSPIIPVDLDYSGTFSAWLPKIAVGYEPNDDLRFSLQVSRGFNPGGVGGSFTALFSPIPLPIEPFFEFDEETVTNYELAMRGRFLDGRLFLAANLFYSDFEDYQLSAPTILLTTPFFLTENRISNAESVETYGLELDADFLVNDRLRLIGSLGLLRSEIKEISTAATPIVGNELPFSPDVTASLGFDYEVSPGFAVGGQVRYTDGYFSDIANTPTARVSSYTTLDLRASYELTESAQMYVYVNNVFDEIAPVSLFAGTPRTGATTTPREIGFGVRATW